MAIIKAKANQSTTVSRGSEGADVFLRATRDGALIQLDWKQALIMEGRGYMITVGAFSTPITGGGAGTAFDQNQPEFVVSVPSGTTLIPLRIYVACQTPLIAADSNETEILIAVDQDALLASAGTSTAETIYNLNTLKGNPSACTAISAATADTTDPTLDLELAHAVRVGDVQGTAANALWGELSLLYEPANPPFINGPAMLVGYWGGTVATTGFATVQWLEVPTTSVST